MRRGTADHDVKQIRCQDHTRSSWRFEESEEHSDLNRS